MCRVVSIALPGNTRSPAQARGWTKMWLDSWGIEDDGVTTLLVSELVTNAVQHTRATTTTLILAIATGTIEAGVTDSERPQAMMPTPREAELAGAARVLSESGRGLTIVEALSHDWGVSAVGIGKQVWFRRPIGTGWPYTTSCACRTDAPTGRRLPSGRKAVAVSGPWDRRTL